MSTVYDDYSSTTALKGADVHKMYEWSFDYYKAHFMFYLPKDKKASILEIGCGYGRFMHFLTMLGYEDITGLDLSQEQVDTARLFGFDNVYCVDALDFLSSHDKKYDLIVALDVFEHIETNSLYQLIRSIRSSLKETGVLIAEFPNALAPLNPHRYGDITHLRSFTVSSIDQPLLSAGFKKEEIKHLPLPPHIHGLKSIVRLLLWFFFINPFLKLFMLVANGTTMGGIFTTNMAVIAKKLS